MCHSSPEERRRRTRDEKSFGRESERGEIRFNRYLIELVRTQTLILIWNSDLMLG